MEAFFSLLRENNIFINVIGGNLSVKFPKGEIDKVLLAELKARKEEIIDYLNRKAIAKLPVIPVLPVQADYTLSSSQGRLWLLSQLEESTASYNMYGTYVFEGDLNVDLLILSFDELILRHEILRTVFKSDGQGEIRQVINLPPGSKFNLDYYDLRNTADQDLYVKQALQENITKPFVLSEGPLLRACLYQVSDHKWVFSYVMHHIISDAWSMGVFFNDLLKYYNGFAAGEKLLLPPLRIQYKDYSGWQRGQLDSISSHKDYWLDQFSGELPVLELPVDKVRPAVKSYNGGLVKHSFPSGLSDRLQKFVRNEGCTLFMGLLSVVNVLLYRFTGQEDLITGSPVAGREDSDLDEQIGFYVNTLALRTRFSGGESFRSLLQIVKGVTLGAYAHQVYPFDALVTDLGLQHNPGRSALFDVMISLQNAGNDEITSALPAGLRLSRYGHVEHVSSKFDLLFNFQEFDDGLHAGIEYNSDLFEQDTILRMADHLEHLLSAVLMAPDSPLYSLSYLGTAERGLLLEGFNATADAGHPSDQTLVSLFEEQVRQTPGHIALVSGKLRLTYRELNACANQLGHYLRENYAIKRDDLVALRVDRNEWMIIAILGVLKAGGAYVPVDPQYPQERLDYMLSDSGSRFLMDEHALEQFRGQMHLYSKEDPFPVNVASDLAYVIYTSGTTGQPKGTLISHYQVVRLFKTDTPLFDFGSSDIWTMFHSYCFDFSVWEMYGALLFGGQLVMVPLMVARDPGAYLELLIDEQVSVLNQTPSSFYNLIRADEERGVPGLKLRYVIFGGEALSPIRLQHWHVRYPWVRLINMYGITETTVHVTYKEIGEKEILNNISNIGKAIPTLRTYVLDGYQQLVPIGVWGELYVGGAGVGRGYLNREVLTRERFIDSWFKEGERLYRSGDRVRVLANGEMEYDGRLDEQVKIRGYRIELGEIKSLLLKHKSIKEAVVNVIRSADHNNQLCAYIVLETPLEKKAIRKYLRDVFPAYMIPEFYVIMNALPLTGNGKIDFKALPAPGVDDDAELYIYHAPVTPLEKNIEQIWKSLLNLKRISLDEDFFELGANSLSVGAFVSRISRDLSLLITIREVFTYPTIAGIAHLLTKRSASITTAIPPADEQRAYVLSSAQQRMWFLSELDENSVAYNIPGAYILEGRLNRIALNQAFDALLVRHETLRTIFEEDDDGNIMQRILPLSADNSICYGDLRREIEQETLLKERVQSGLYKRLSLATGPLLNTSLYQLTDSKWVFTYLMHHIISDGWSMGIFIKELLVLYNAFNKNEIPELLPLRIQYKDYAVWQQAQLSSGAFEAHNKYWQAQFQGKLPVLVLPADRQRPVVKTYNGSSLKTGVSKEIADGLKEYIRKQEGTLFMGVFTAINALLATYSGQYDIILGTSVAGREYPELEDQLGLYVNTIALRTRFSETTTYNELFHQVKQITLDGYEHQAYPFDELIRTLDLKRDASRNLLFDVMVVLQNTKIDVNNTMPEIEELSVSRYKDNQHKSSQFDLSFDFFDTGEELMLGIEYNTDLFHNDTIALIAEHLKHLLLSMPLNGNQKISDLDYKLKPAQPGGFTEIDEAVKQPKKAILNDLRL